MTSSKISHESDHEARGRWLTQALDPVNDAPAGLTDRALAAAFGSAPTTSFSSFFLPVALRFFWGSTACAVVAVIVLLRLPAGLTTQPYSSSTTSDDDEAAASSWHAWQSTSLAATLHTAPTPSEGSSTAEESP
jgi:hypothetical protein